MSLRVILVLGSRGADHSGSPTREGNTEALVMEGSLRRFEAARAVWKGFSRVGPFGNAFEGFRVAANTDHYHARSCYFQRTRPLICKSTYM